MALKTHFLKSLRGGFQGVLGVILTENGELFTGRRKGLDAVMSYLVQRALLAFSPQLYMTRFIH